MKILVVGSNYPPESRGGTEMHMQDLARALQKRGHEVSVYCKAADGNRPDYELRHDVQDGIPVTRLNYNYGDVRGLTDIWSNPKIESLFDAELERLAPDLVHFHHLSGLSTRLIERAKHRGLPVVMTLHDFWMVCPRGQRITAELEVCETLDRKRCTPCLSALWPHLGVTEENLQRADAEILARLRLCDLLLTPSAAHRERMLELDLDPNKILALAHGLDLERISKRTETRFPPRKIGFIGSVIPSKGVHVLIEAINRIGDPELECHIFGEVANFHGDTSYGERLRALARTDLRFQFHGPYSPSELATILGGLDLLVVPSLWWESYCLTIREGMLAGIPVLASDHGAMHEALAEIREDLLFRPGDAQDLGYKIYALTTDRAHYERASSLRHRVKSLATMAEETEAQYRGLVGFPERKREAKAALAFRKRKGTQHPYVTVFVPTWNGGLLFEQVLSKIRIQETSFDYEILIIDSGSRDGTLDAVRRCPEVRFIEIPNSEFNHGLTRNRAVREARGEIVVLLTHDAEPYDSHWLERLIANFDDPDVAGAYCHQLPRPDCNPFQRDRLQGWTHGEGTPVVKRLFNREHWEKMHPYDRFLLMAFDDVASAVRKSVMEVIPFEKRQFGEDVAWGKQAILAGHALVMDPRSVVIHSHNKPIFYEFKRVYLDHQNLFDLVGLRTVPTLWHVAKFSVKAWLHLSLVVFKDSSSIGNRLLWLLKTPLYSFTQNLAQYLGARSVIEERRGFWGALDRTLRKGV